MRMCPRAACQKRLNDSKVGGSKILRRMHTAAHVTEKRTLQMDAQRLGAVRGGSHRPRGTLNRIRQPVKSRTRFDQAAAVTVVGK